MRHCGVPVVAHVRSPDAAKNLGGLAKKFCTGINPNPSDACGWVPPSQSTRLHALTRRSSNVATGGPYCVCYRGLRLRAWARRSLPSRVRVPRPRVGACGVERTGWDAVPRGLSRSAAARRGRGVSVGRRARPDRTGTRADFPNDSAGARRECTAAGSFIWRAVRCGGRFRPGGGPFVKAARPADDTRGR